MSKRAAVAALIVATALAGCTAHPEDPPIAPTTVNTTPPTTGAGGSATTAGVTTTTGVVLLPSDKPPPGPGGVDAAKACVLIAGVDLDLTSAQAYPIVRQAASYADDAAAADPDWQALSTAILNLANAVTSPEWTADNGVPQLVTAQNDCDALP